MLMPSADRVTRGSQAAAPCAACRRDLNPRHFRRGLCRRCRQDPLVRAAHPPRRYTGLAAAEHPDAWQDTVCRRPLPLPTGALPGTPEKIAALALRVRLRLEPHHPDDARAPSPRQPRRGPLLQLAG